MSDRKETPDEIRARVEANCAATSTAVGGYNVLRDGKPVPAFAVQRDGVEQYLTLDELTKAERKALGIPEPEAAEPAASTDASAAPAAASKRK
jgi:hypothetical protein